MHVAQWGNVILSQLPNCITSPPWWQLMNWIADPLGFQDRYSRKYGDIFTMRLGGMGSYVVISNPQAIQEIFSQDSKFDIGRGNALAEPLVGQNSLMLLDGDRHRRERKILMPPFHGERLQTYAQQICLITEQVASQWQVSQPFVARTAMQKISLEVILQVVFGLSEGERYQQLKPLLTDWLNMTDSPLRSSMLFLRFLQQDWGARTPWGQMKQRQRQVHELLQAEIEERRARGNQERTDVLSLMMAARDEQGQAMTDEELRDELLTILFAGHETTATTLAWAFYQIHQQLDVREKLLKELDSLGENSSPMEIAQLPYLTAVCQETLRMYPVLPVIFPRIAKVPVNVAGYSFDTGTILMPTIYLVHYREDLYPNAQQFEPERFLERQYSASEYFPFGGGSRRCLGYALALLEMKLVLATILPKYHLALAEDKPVKLQRRGFTLAPTGGVRMMMTEKR
jgi:cytochrome P450 family 110